MTAARAAGLAPARLALAHLLPAMRPSITAQFLLLIPGFIVSETTLGLLGLGVMEPLPSLGGLLAELQNLPAVAENPLLLLPAGVVVLILACLRALIPEKEALTR
jgi:ABC-type dipeptide/oligopeptide/nickel transport system permease subunit